MPPILPPQEATPFYVGTVLAKGGKVFYTYIDQDREQVASRTLQVWEASVLRDRESTYEVAPLAPRLGPAAAELRELSGL